MWLFLVCEVVYLVTYSMIIRMGIDHVQMDIDNHRLGLINKLVLGMSTVCFVCLIGMLLVTIQAM